MNEISRANIWKLTAIGVVVVAATAVVTGLVVANRTVREEAKLDATAPAASPSTPVTPGTVVTPKPATPPVPSVAQTPPAAETPKSGVPSREVVNACNQQAANAAGAAPRQGKDYAWDVGKDAGIGAIGGAAVGAVGGAIADGGKGAGKGAIIGGLVGAGGGTLYGIWDNKKNDERFRGAYSSCMKSKGYMG